MAVTSWLYDRCPVTRPEMFSEGIVLQFCNTKSYVIVSLLGSTCKRVVFNKQISEFKGLEMSVNNSVLGLYRWLIIRHSFFGNKGGGDCTKVDLTILYTVLSRLG